MSADGLHERLTTLVASRGWLGRVVAAERVAGLRVALEDLRASGAFDPDFYDIELADTFEWEPPAGLGAARSVVVLAAPAPVTRLTFRWRGDDRTVAMPPTYRHYRVTRATMLAVVGELLEEGGFSVHAGHLPEKSLAVRCGLARYGRNNIAFVPGFGSHALLATGWSDLPVADDRWGEPRVLERCEACRACAEACPTGAIALDRFLLRGERCLTHLNEWPGAFPAWVPARAHNAVVGCMLCQDACPENRAAGRAAAGIEEVGPMPAAVRAAWRDDEGPRFDEAETRALLAGTAREELPAATIAKLESLDTFLEHESLCRNLAAVLLSPEPSSL